MSVMTMFSFIGLVFGFHCTAVVSLSSGNVGRRLLQEERVLRVSASRRDWIQSGCGSAVLLVLSPEVCTGFEEESAAFPEEVSGLVVLRVAEVASFQERLLRGFADGVDFGVPITWIQFAFGTEILLRNTNLDGNLRLMIAEEIPRAQQKQARESAAAVMNSVQGIVTFANDGAKKSIDLQPVDAVALADLYSGLEAKLLDLFTYLPADTQDKYQGYAKILHDYEVSASANCQGGAGGGCLEDDSESTAMPDEVPSRPKPGQAPAALGAAIREKNKQTASSR